MRQITLTFALLLAVHVVYGQAGKLRRADNYYHTLAFALAADQYEGLLGSEVDSPQMQSKLAYSYFRTEQFEKAEKIYATVLEKSSDTEDMYRYAQVLKINGKYALSDEWMSKFAALKPEDARSQSFMAQKNYREYIEASAPRFSIENWKNNTEFTDFGAYPSLDQTRLYFLSNRSERAFIHNNWTWNNERFLELHVATMDARNEVVNQEVLPKKVNSRFHEGPVGFHPNGKWVVYTRNNMTKGSKRKDKQGIQNLKLYIADIRDGKWVNEREFTYNSKDYSVGHPGFTPDGKWMYFSSDKPGGFGGADIYKVAVKEDGTFGEPVNLGKEINTEGQEMFPWISPEGHLFFSSDGLTGLGGLDLFVWLSDNGNFTEVRNCGTVLNSSYDDFALSTLKDGKEGYFSSNRPGGKGGDDIYHFQQLTPFNLGLLVKGTTKDKNSGILAQTKVWLMNAAAQKLDSVLSDENGNFEFRLKRDMNYQLVAQKPDYFDGKASVTTIQLPAETRMIEKDLMLEKDPGFALLAIIKDAKTSQMLDSVKVEITDVRTDKQVIADQTDSKGEIFQSLASNKIGDVLNYTIKLSRPGYLTKELKYTVSLTQAGVIELHKALDLNMDKLAAGIDLATVIDIKPIYFDLGKYIIRKDAARELDKIVKVMTDYPTMVIELGSHTDCRGSIASNEKLSDNRAKASAAYIKARIQNPERIYGKGYGESKLKNGCACEGPVKSTCSETEHQENRRTEFIIQKM
ncbi:OmpA family protein [Fluviicola sp.]|uniref:OmpA family protein n=1 Tax=Fluviicola sp. TaxID=1917219 RepID=UPI0031CFE07D